MDTAKEFTYTQTAMSCCQPTSPTNATRAKTRKIMASSALTAIYSIVWWAFESQAIPIIYQWCESPEAGQLGPSLEKLLNLLFPAQIHWAIIASLAAIGLMSLLWIASNKFGYIGNRSAALVASCIIAIAPIVVCIGIQVCSTTSDPLGYVSNYENLAVIIASIAIVAAIAIAIVVKSNKRPFPFSSYLAMTCVAALGPLGIGLGLLAYFLVSIVGAIAVTIILLPIILPTLYVMLKIALRIA